MKATAPSRRQQRGQSMVEFCIVVPLFLFMLLLIFQLVLIYRAKATLDYAAMQAARAGAVNGANKSSMRSGLASGLVPLWTTSPDTGGLIAARARTVGEASDVYSTLTVLNPTPAIWNELRERQYDGRLALPNDTLGFRSRNVGSNQVNVQDANILRIKVRYHYPLIVPFVDRVIIGVSRLLNNGPDFRPTDAPFLWVKDPLTGHYRLPLVSSAEVRMQSPIYDSSQLR
jgi:hypothetical protein